MQEGIFRKIVSVCFSVSVLTFSAAAQLSPESALEKLYNNYPQEKIYLWLNKPAYVTGETLWFKAYLFSGYDLSFISTTIYVELYDAQKKLIGKRMMPVMAGAAEGSIDLDKKLNEGVYYIRAYTNWMLNFNEGFQYIQPVLIYNPVSQKKLTINNAAWKAFARPEGGSLIDGLETKIAIRRVAAASSDQKWSGYLYEESEPSVKLNEFSSLDENVALFSFTPVIEKKYYVYVKDQQNHFQVCPLPTVNKNGVGISVEKINDSITYKLSFRNIPDKDTGYSIIGEIQNQLVYKAVLRKTPKEIILKMPVSDLDNGILHLTVFDAAKKPVSERLIFLNQSKLNFDSSVIFQQKFSAQPRSKNEIELTVDSINWINYAVSVSDADAPSSLENNNILSSLLLNSDLTNPVWKPASYFNQPDQNKMAALDAMMISEKWTRFDWHEILTNKFPVIKYFPANYLSYSGIVKKGNKLKPNDEVNLFLTYPDSSSQLILTQTDSTGNLFLDNLFFTGEVKIYYQLNSKKYAAKLIDINFESNNRFVPYSLPFPQTPYSLVAADSAEKSSAWIERATNTVNLEKDIESKYKTMEGVFIQSNLKSRKEALNEKLSSGRFQSINEVIFDFVNEEQDATGFSNILQWLQGRVAGLYLQMEDGEDIPYIRNNRASIYLDEMQVDSRLISSFSIRDIAMIKIIKGPSVMLGGSSIIAIYTSRGDLRSAIREPSLPNNKLTGYDIVKKIFSPDYNNSAPQPDKDTRDLLLWKTLLPPEIAIDKSNVSFFNNDNAKRFRVIIQGFNANGFPVYFEKIIEPSAKSF